MHSPPRSTDSGNETEASGAKIGAYGRMAGAKGDGADKKIGGDESEQRLHRSKGEPGGSQLDRSNGGDGTVERAAIRTE